MPDAPQSPATAPTTILARHKGKAAGAAAMIPLLYALVDCYTTAQHNKAMLHKQAGEIWESIPASVYYSNLMEIRLEIAELKRGRINH